MNVAPHLPSDTGKRKTLKSLAGILGLSLSAQAMDALAEFEPKAVSASGNARLFSAAQLLCAAALADIVIPATDTPGATGAGVHLYLDHHVQVCTSAAQQTSLLRFLDAIDQQSQAEFGKRFSELSEAQRQTLTALLHEGTTPFSEGESQVWRQFISLVTFAYYTSEVGATQELSYLAIPGGYDGDVPFSDVGRSWSLAPFV
ncbi:gluconate 2-dehydrogenase subunit 3 family protein [Gilvimarinus agarilyticus]|uniref:gluconate 2-dehydrogenase subunit 3 family protein n=1 Tax=Gilvimarinus agarilyticus TaxID=679259 RepID=UPI000698F724|nr:gluconate 2-dehydrogenase subunit 3 family protein [Gilvimarinus agarilyticus]